MSETRQRMVRVEFINDQTGDLFAVSDIPGEELPSSFGPATQVAIDESEWEVVQASPAHAQEFLARGKLTLQVRKIVRVNPKDVLFSLPTISNELPQIQPRSLRSGRELEFHEDDWRQTELVSAKCDEMIDAELADIRRILSEERKGPGFRRIHVRSRIPAPFSAERSIAGRSSCMPQGC